LPSVAIPVGGARPPHGMTVEARGSSTTGDGSIAMPLSESFIHRIIGGGGGSYISAARRWSPSQRDKLGMGKGQRENKPRSIDRG
jgi:hypothetical protein